MIHEDSRENERQLNEPLLSSAKSKRMEVIPPLNDTIDESLMMFQSKGGKTPSDLQLFMISVKLFFGISYLSMPNTLAQCGIIGGISLFVFVMGLNGLTMLQLIWTSEKFRGVTNYSDLGEKIYGKGGRRFVNACILIKQLCACISYLYFVSTQLDFVMCEAMGLCYGNRVFIVILVVPVFLMSMANSYSFLSYLSIPSIMIAILGMLCTFFYSFSELLGGRTSN